MASAGNNKEEALTVGKLGAAIKTWLPIIITVGSLVLGYFLFKSETRHQFELQQRETNSLRQDVQGVREDIDQNRREWQSNIESQVDKLRESNIRMLMRIKVLENRPLDSED
jgi:D-alanyl-lipoteichoic acid acyltransferase DltB (MBOAT superfamily)